MRHLAFILLVLLSFAPVAPARAAEATTPGSACVTGASRADWDAIFQCVASVWQRAAVMVGSSSASCNASISGMLQWTGSTFQVCNGSTSTWTALGSGGGNYYGIQSQTGIKRSTLTYSNTLQFNATASQTVTVSGQGSPQLSVAGGAWTTTTTIVQGQAIQLRMTSAASDSTTYTATLTTGSDSMQWTVTTAPLSSYLGGGSSHFITDCPAAGGSTTTPGQLGYTACQFAGGCPGGWASTGWGYYTGNFCRQGDYLYCAGQNDCTSPTGWYNYVPYCQYCNRTCEVNCGCGCYYPTCYSSLAYSWCI